MSLRDTINEIIDELLIIYDDTGLPERLRPQEVSSDDVENEVQESSLETEILKDPTTYS